MHKKNSPVRVKFGRIEFVKLNAERQDFRDIYHWLLTLSWPQFSGLILAVYLAVNLIFSAFYYLGRPCIAGADSFSDAFFFSVETLATVGYGHLYPQTLYGHIVATVEIMAGMFGMAVITGLIFIRFSRPLARIVFSRNLVISPFDGQPALMMRVANLRHHAMAEAEFRMMLIRTVWVKEGEHMRRFYPLTLQFDRVIAFPVALTIRHIIDAKSPLHGLTAEDLKESDARIFASVVCIDTVISSSIQSQQDYTWRDIHFGKRFVEIYNDLDATTMTVDYGRLHDIEDIPDRKTEPAPGVG
ncbi:MAG TPA: ion channel [Candidatus Methylacidiphilales bacterium]|nr:ion channel [Candidatus Methylacidiphilales bacterium]